MKENYLCVKCGHLTKRLRYKKLTGWVPLCERCVPIQLKWGKVSEPIGIRKQREEYHGDLVQPWDGLKPNQEFIERYPNESPWYYGKKELAKHQIQLNPKAKIAFERYERTIPSAST